MHLELSDDLRTGIDCIDEQHRSLIELHNEIVAGFDREQPHAATIEALARLYLYCRQHFDSEEKIMRRYGYPGLDAHRRDHAAHLERLRQVILDYREDPEASRNSIESFVSHWIVGHIEDADLDFALRAVLFAAVETAISSAVAFRPSAGAAIPVNGGCFTMITALSPLGVCMARRFTSTPPPRWCWACCRSGSLAGSLIQPPVTPS